MKSDHEILLVDDDRAMAELTSYILARHGYRTVLAHSAAEGISLLKARYFPIVVSDLLLGDGDGFSLMPFLKSHHRQSLIIFVTGYGSIGTTVKALHEGAFEYISKAKDAVEMETELLPTIQRAVRQLETIEQPKMEQVADPSSFHPALIGKSAPMIRVYRSVAKAALSRGNAVILGESGSGKELIAKAIHENSPWSKQPFVTVNCGALTETLLESELFGHVKGSFTGATANKRGLFEEADKGTIFLDEIGDISLMSQVKLLRAIQEGEIRPVGSVEVRKIDVRVIAATHRDIRQRVKEEKFREDLYYRLKVFEIEVPPLRDRIEDLPALVHHFIGICAKKGGYGVTGISPEAMDLLKSYAWPGNIRELENAIERAAAMAKSTILFPEDFPQEVIPSVKPSAPMTATVLGPDGRSLEDLEREHIVRTLESLNYNKSKAAEMLGIDRGTLYRKASRYSIPLHDIKQN